MRSIRGRTGAVVSALLLLRERRALAVVAEGGHAGRWAAGLGLLFAPARDQEPDPGEEEDDDDDEDAVGECQVGLVCGKLAHWFDGRRWCLGAYSRI